MRIRLALITLSLLGLIAAMALLLSQVRQDTWRFAAWPPTVLAWPCTSASLYLDQRLVVDQDLASAAAVLTQAWREVGWEVNADIHAEGQGTTLTARRGDQSFEANLTAENGSFHLVAKGVQRCVMERRG